MIPLEPDIGDEQGIKSVFIGRARELDALRATLTAPQQRVAIVQGLRGTGKTALLMAFHHQGAHLFPGGYESTYGFGPETPAEVAQRRLRLPVEDRALLVIDDADMMAPEARAALTRLLPANPNLRVLMAASEPLSLDVGTPEVIALPGFSQAEYFDLLSRRLSNVDPELVRRLWASTAGHALTGDLASRTISEHLLTWHQLLQAVEGSSRSPLFGPDGRRVEPSAPIPQPIVEAVSNVNTEIIEMLRRDPDRFYSLSPRKFEEIVADLLSQLGYAIELTPASGDGGFDMYAARNDGLGRFLYLVECKRYTPPSKVGVGVVRSLYGVVQQKRANAGIVATTSFFTKGAEALQQELAHQMQLRDYIALQKWLT